MVGIQLTFSLLFMGLAIWLLRPVFRRQQDRPARTTWFRRGKQRVATRRRVFAVPPCGDDAMGWKERHFTRTDVFTKLFVMPATAVAAVFLILASQIDETCGRAFTDLWRQGYWLARYSTLPFN